MMLADQDDAGKPAVPAGADDLFGVEGGGGEDGGILIAVPPLLSGEGVESEVHDCIAAAGAAAEEAFRRNAPRIELLQYRHVNVLS
ncbi:MAG: hypothetical protein L6W00_17145 [Lentisphaeria bacterium]|nr:MAG: hypothetical protein L6W00_17145 [Lentisphaeria bacterium]